MSAHGHKNLANIQCLPKQLQISWTWIIEQVRMESVLVVKCYWWNSGLVWWIFNMFQSGDNFSRDFLSSEPELRSRSRRWSPRRQLGQVAAHLTLCVSEKLQRLQTQLRDISLCAEILQETRDSQTGSATTWCSQDKGRRLRRHVYFVMMINIDTLTVAAGHGSLPPPPLPLSPPNPLPPLLPQRPQMYIIYI